VVVADRGIRECVDPEGNGVTMGRGAEGGLGLPSGERDKQLICNSGGGKTSMGEPGGQPDGSMRHQKLIMHRVCNIVKQQSLLHCVK
jgi:hypothetical protein